MQGRVQLQFTYASWKSVPRADQSAVLVPGCVPLECNSVDQRNCGSVKSSNDNWERTVDHRGEHIRRKLRG